MWGFRHPWTWSFVLLTKVTPAVGLLWFVVRREWRKLGIALGASAALAALSVVFWGDQWPGYIALITTGKAPAVWPYYLTLYQRLPFAILLVVIGAWRNWKWTVPAASCLAAAGLLPDQPVAARRVSAVHPDHARTVAREPRVFPRAARPEPCGRCGDANLPVVTSPSVRGHRWIAPLVGVGVAVVAFFVYWLTNQSFEAGRGDFFYLADAFLHGRAWIDFAPGAYDVIYGADGRVYVPFAPFPAIVLMPLVAVVGAVTADQWESGINAALAAFGAAARVVGHGPDRRRAAARPVRPRPAARLRDADVVGHDPRRRVAHRPPHRDHPRDAACWPSCSAGSARSSSGLLVGPSFLTRAPVAFLGPAIALWYWLLAPADGRDWLRRIPWRQWALLIVGFLPGLAVFFAYNYARFGSPLESGLRAGDAARLAGDASASRACSRRPTSR